MTGNTNSLAISQISFTEEVSRCFAKVKLSISLVPIAKGIVCNIFIYLLKYFWINIIENGTLGKTYQEHYIVQRNFEGRTKLNKIFYNYIKNEFKKYLPVKLFSFFKALHTGVFILTFLPLCLTVVTLKHTILIMNNYAKI